MYGEDSEQKYACHLLHGDCRRTLTSVTVADLATAGPLSWCFLFPENEPVSFIPARIQISVGQREKLRFSFVKGAAQIPPCRHHVLPGPLEDVVVIRRITLAWYLQVVDVLHDHARILGINRAGGFEGGPEHEWG